jgi:Flp pilus assembly pilin Flp
MALQMLHAGSCGRHPVPLSAPLKGNTTMHLFKRLWQEEGGQDLTEYALLLVLLALAAVGSMSNVASAINGVFAKAVQNLNST